MQLVILESSADSIRAGYLCPCGCRPSVVYERGAAPVNDGCCCGNEFTVGPSTDQSLEPRADYHTETEAFRAPWGDPLVAQWLVGPSVHGDESHDHQRAEADNHAHSQDPVCGMSVDRADATAKLLTSTHNDHLYYFCGRGCKLEFDEDPARYLDPSYVPSM